MSWSETELRKLYLEEKKSSKDIAKLSKCSEHKVNYWLLKYAINKRSLSEAIYVHHNPHGDPFRLKEIRTLADAKLFGLGLGLYWGEGNKKNKSAVRLGNTDPQPIKKFIEFLTKICNVQPAKMRFGLQIFGDMVSKTALRFWLEELREFHVSPKQFFKVTVTPHRGIGNYRAKTKHGVLTIHVNNIKLKKLIDSLLPE